MVSEQDKQQLGEGSTNYVDAAQKTVKAIQEVGKAAAEKTTLAASEATANATAAVAQTGLEGGKAVSEVAAGTAAGGPWGAILAAAWALRKPLFKVLICIGLVILFFIIAPFDAGIIYTAFHIDPDDVYEKTTGTTYGTAIKTMADALKMTLYGTLAAGDIPELTNEELVGIVSGLHTTDARKKLVETALSLVGKVSYFWGGKSPAGWNDEWGKPKKVTSSGSVTSGTLRPYGLDCSGFTDWVYKTALGQSIGTGSASQWSKSTEISASELLPGDLGFKAKPSDPGTNHVLMYVGLTSDGKRQWVHCSSSAGGVVLNTPSYVKYYRRPNGIDYSAPAGSSVGGLGTPLYTRKVNVTHYCACSKCCGDNADGITASGKRVAPGMVAMSSYYPFGTVLVINGEVYTVEDRGGSGIENDIARVDIYVEDHQQALRLGRYWAEATFYRIGR